MLNRSASLAMSTSILKALPGKLDIKRHSPNILYVIHKDEKGNKVMLFLYWLQMSCDMRFPTMWYVRPANPQISLRIRAV